MNGLSPDFDLNQVRVIFLFFQQHRFYVACFAAQRRPDINLLAITFIVREKRLNNGNLLRRWIVYRSRCIRMRVFWQLFRHKCNKKIFEIFIHRLIHIVSIPTCGVVTMVKFSKRLLRVFSLFSRVFRKLVELKYVPFSCLRREMG